MRRDLFVETERFAIAGGFSISRGTRTHAEVVTCTLRQEDAVGRGECVPYARYGETLESVMAAIEGMRGAIADGMNRADLISAMPAGAGRDGGGWGGGGGARRAAAWSEGSTMIWPACGRRLCTSVMGPSSAIGCNQSRRWRQRGQGATGRRASRGVQAVADGVNRLYAEGA
jgi:hypothetical protein